MWSVVHRQKPMFVAVVSDRSVDHLDQIPPGAIHWAKQASAADDGTLLREALEAIRSFRSGKQPIVGEITPQPQHPRPDRPRQVRRGNR